MCKFIRLHIYCTFNLLTGVPLLVLLIHICTHSLEIILRVEAVEMVQAGDKCDFIGTLVVVPDVSQLRTEGVRAETSTRMRDGEGYDRDGVRGLKALGVRDLTYRLAFLACAVQQTQPGVSIIMYLHLFLQPNCLYMYNPTPTVLNPSRFLV